MGKMEVEMCCWPFKDSAHNKRILGGVVPRTDRNCRPGSNECWEGDWDIRVLPLLREGTFLSIPCTWRE